MKREYENKITNTLNELTLLEKEQKELRKKFKDYNGAGERMATINSKETLTTELAEQLIDKVLVYNDKRVDVFFSFDDNKKRGDNVE